MVSQGSGVGWSAKVKEFCVQLMFRGRVVNQGSRVGWSAKVQG